MRRRGMIPGGRWPSACVLFVALASMPLGRAAYAKDKKGKAKPKEAAATAVTPAGGQRFTVDGVREPSGIAVVPGGRLFVVGDEGTVAELSADGRTLRVDRVPANLEDVAFHAPSG